MGILDVMAFRRALRGAVRAIWCFTVCFVFSLINQLFMSNFFVDNWTSFNNDDDDDDDCDGDDGRDGEGKFPYIFRPLLCRIPALDRPVHLVRRFA